MRKIISGVLGALLLAALAAVAALAFSGYRLYQSARTQQPLEQLTASLRAREDYTPYDQLPTVFLDALVAVEDEDFYTHHGFSPTGIARALLTNLRAGEVVEGGSTITQQLAKNLYFSSEQSILRKVAELFAAVDLERTYSKKDILELYVNTIYYGNGYYGVTAAARGYFGCEPLAMSDDVCTLLAGVPQAPSAYALREHLELARQRQQTVLDRMESGGFLTAAQRQAIAAQTAETDALLTQASTGEGAAA